MTERDNEIRIHLKAIEGCLLAALELVAMCDGVGAPDLVLSIAAAHSTAAGVRASFSKRQEQEGEGA